MTPHVHGCTGKRKYATRELALEALGGDGLWHALQPLTINHGDWTFLAGDRDARALPRWCP